MILVDIAACQVGLQRVTAYPAFCRYIRHRLAEFQTLPSTPDCCITAPVAASQRFNPTMHSSLPGLGQRTSLLQHSNADLRLPRAAGSTSVLQRASGAHHLRYLVSWWDAVSTSWQATSGQMHVSCSATSMPLMLVCRPQACAQHQAGMMRSEACRR